MQEETRELEFKGWHCRHEMEYLTGAFCYFTSGKAALRQSRACVFLVPLSCDRATQWGSKTELISDFLEQHLSWGDGRMVQGRNREKDCSEGNQKGWQDQDWPIMDPEVMEGLPEDRMLKPSQE